MNNASLSLHYMARAMRPSNNVLAMIGAHYKGVRFRVVQNIVNLSVGRRTITHSVIEVLTEGRNGFYHWVTYQFLNPEDTE